MITTQRYFIHIDNKSVVPWTSEIEDNYKFKEITAKVAMAIERGVISADEVVEQITKKIKPGTLEQMLEAKLKMNVRESNLNLESQVKEDNSQKDTSTPAPYDVAIPGEATPAEAGAKKSGKRVAKPKDTESEKKGEAGDDDIASAGKVAAALDGGVNV